MQSENPVTRDYWLGEVDPRPLALFRILFGSITLVSLLQRLPDVRFFFSDEGYAPRGSIPALMQCWSLFWWVGSPGTVLTLYWLGILAVVALTVGFRTRIASVATFLFIASLQLRNPIVSFGPDRIMGVMSFWLMLADTGGAWSLDRRMGRRSGPTVAAAGLRLLQWQVAFVYLFAAFAKRKMWGSGLALLHIMQGRELARPAGEWLTRWPSLSIAFNWLVLAAEAGVPLLLIPLTPLSPKWMRTVGIAGGLALFLGVFLTMRVGSFPEFMIATLVLFLLPEWLDRVGAVDRTFVKAAPPIPLPKRLPVLIAGGLQLCLVAWFLLSFHLGWPESQLIRAEVQQLNLDQAWTMFSKEAIPLNAWWTDAGILVNGGRTEVLGALAPQMVTTEPPKLDWQNFRGALMANAYRRERVLFGRYVCRTFNRAAPVPLRELELTLHVRPFYDPGDPPPEERVSQVYHLPCQSEPAEEHD